MNPYYDPGKPHHRPQDFQNVYMEFTLKSLEDVLRWRWDASRRGLPPPPHAPIPRLAPDLDFLHHNAKAAAQMQPAVTWIGHATVLAQLGGLPARAGLPVLTRTPQRAGVVQALIKAGTR